MSDLSSQDALTDLSAKGVPLEIDGVSDAFCHSAMLRCAEYVKAELENRQLLEKAFSSLEVRALHKCMDMSVHISYFSYF